MMKRQENKQRFYLWDYLWWVGERLHEYHLRITGESMLFMYFNFLLYVRKHPIKYTNNNGRIL